MAYEDFMRDLSTLRNGPSPDLTLNFCGRTCAIHKLLAWSSSKWFKRMLASSFKETQSGVVDLQDEDEYVNAIECMISYFYDAGYDAARFDQSISLLHGQVTVIADKYDCASLCSLAKALFKKTILEVTADEWVDVASFLYIHTTSDVPAHIELRNSLITAVMDRNTALKSSLQNENFCLLCKSRFRSQKNT